MQSLLASWSHIRRPCNTVCLVTKHPDTNPGVVRTSHAFLALLVAQEEHPQTAHPVLVSYRRMPRQADSCCPQVISYLWRYALRSSLYVNLSCALQRVLVPVDLSLHSLVIDPWLVPAAKQDLPCLSALGFASKDLLLVSHFGQLADCLDVDRMGLTEVASQDPH